MFTSNLRRQHAEIKVLIGMIVPLLKPQALNRKVADELRKMLIALSARVNTHLVSEDRVLYPRLMSSKVATTAQTATRFFQEMGDVGASFKDYMVRYHNAEVIATDPEKFSQDTHTMVSVLNKRIGLEETELYPQADVR